MTDCWVVASKLGTDLADIDDEEEEEEESSEEENLHSSAGTPPTFLSSLIS